MVDSIINKEILIAQNMCSNCIDIGRNEVKKNIKVMYNLDVMFEETQKLKNQLNNLNKMSMEQVK